MPATFKLSFRGVQAQGYTCSRFPEFEIAYRSPGNAKKQPAKHQLPELLQVQVTVHSEDHTDITNHVLRGNNPLLCVLVNGVAKVRDLHFTTVSSRFGSKFILRAQAVHNQQPQVSSGESTPIVIWSRRVRAAHTRTLTPTQPVQYLPQIGRTLTARLRAQGIETISDLATAANNMSVPELFEFFSSHISRARSRFRFEDFQQCVHMAREIVARHNSNPPASTPSQVLVINSDNADNGNSYSDSNSNDDNNNGGNVHPDHLPIAEYFEPIVPVPEPELEFWAPVEDGWFEFLTQPLE